MLVILTGRFVAPLRTRYWLWLRVAFAGLPGLWTFSGLQHVVRCYGYALHVVSQVLLAENRTVVCRGRRFTMFLVQELLVVVLR